jgi:hypothetical protein
MNGSPLQNGKRSEESSGPDLIAREWYRQGEALFTPRNILPNVLGNLSQLHFFHQPHPPAYLPHSRSSAVAPQLASVQEAPSAARYQQVRAQRLPRARPCGKTRQRPMPVSRSRYSMSLASPEMITSSPPLPSMA